MKSYLNLLSHILENGEKREDRTNIGTIASFGHQLKFDLRDGFPAVTTKKLAWKGIVSELIWFLEGSDDERRLAEIRYNKNRNELTDIEKYPTIWFTTIHDCVVCTKEDGKLVETIMSKAFYDAIGYYARFN